MAVDFVCLNEGERALLGLSAGVIEIAINQPLLYWKNVSQQGLALSIHPRVVYRGLFASAANMGGLTALQFLGTGMFQRHLQQSRYFDHGDPARAAVQVGMAAAMLSGALSGLPGSYLELVMIQQQRWGGSFAATTRRIASTFGATRGLMRGVTMTVTRETVFTGGYLGLQPALQRYLRFEAGLGLDSSPVVAGLIASVVSGVTAGTLTHPVDTIKTCMQGDIERKVYTTVARTLGVLLRERGMRGLFAGWSFRVGRMVAATFIVNEAKNRLAPVMFPECWIPDE